MIFIIPFLIFIFICLFVSKLAGAAVSWFIVLLPLILVILFFGALSFFGKRAKKTEKIQDKK